MTCLLPLMYIAGINLYLILWNSIALVHLWGRHYTWCPSNACPAHVREEGQWKVQCRTRSGWTVSPGRGGSRTIGNGTTGVYRKTWHFTASLQTDQGLAEGGLYNMDWFIYIRWFSRCLMYIYIVFHIASAYTSNTFCCIHAPLTSFYHILPSSLTSLQRWDWSVSAWSHASKRPWASGSRKASWRSWVNIHHKRWNRSFHTAVNFQRAWSG